MDSAPAPKPQLGHHQKPSKTFTKFLSCFLYRTVTSILFLVLVPVLTSRPPEFIVPTGRSWEILPVIIVSIVVSYGLFGRRRKAAGAEEEKNGTGNGNGNGNGNYQNLGKSENALSYVHRFLQVSSLFDDESDGGCGGGSGSGSTSGSDVGRIQFMGWNIQYFRNEPMLVVDEDRNGGSSSARISDKPLLLPIRSLRSRVSDGSRGNAGEPGALPASSSWSDSMSFGSRVSEDARNCSNAGSILESVLNGLDHLGESGVLKAPISRFDANPESIPKRPPRGGSNMLRNERFCDIGYPESETSMQGSVVLPSPIPWRSRSERMETMESVDSAGNTGEAVEYVSVRPQFSRSLSTTSSRANPVLSPATRSSPLPKEASPSSSSALLSMPSEATVVADSVKKKSSSHKSRIPAPPPPPLHPTTIFKLPSEKPSLVSPRNASRDVIRTHPKSARTIRAPSESTQRNMLVKDLRENFFDEVLENEGRKQLFEKMTTEDTAAVAAKDLEVLSIEEEVVSDSNRHGRPDVDKEADEFIAKFRQQILLQRIDSMKRSIAVISNDDRGIIDPLKR